MIARQRQGLRMLRYGILIDDTVILTPRAFLMPDMLMPDMLMPDMPSVLATDLDGTFIPLSGNQANRRDLDELQREIKSRGIALVFVTGRHLSSILNVMESESLPTPDWIISNVGTSISCVEERDQIVASARYADHLSQIISECPISKLRQEFSGFDQLTAQEAEKQGPFKLSYYCDADSISTVADQINEHLHKQQSPYRLIASVDPFNGDGLIDLLPAGVSKAYAIDWWCQDQGLNPSEVIFAGDSGNDFAALTAGYRSILVGNASRDLAVRVQESHATNDWKDRLCLANEPATSGVLHGLRHYCDQ